MIAPYLVQGSETTWKAAQTLLQSCPMRAHTSHAFNTRAIKLGARHRGAVARGGGAALRSGAAAWPLAAVWRWPVYLLITTD